MKTPVTVTAVRIFRLGDHVHLEAEVDGEWRALATEHLESNFSHIVEGAGIADAPKSIALRGAIAGIEATS